MVSHTLLKEIDLSEIPKQTYLIEIGSIRELQPPDSIENSTCFLDKLAREHNLRFITVDLSEYSYKLASSYVGKKAILSDGSEFLKKFKQPISILYLDNFDVVYNEIHRQSLMRRVKGVYKKHNEILTNERSAEVHLEQVKVAMPLLTKPSFIGIDDTMIKMNKWWGKGAKAVPFLLKNGYKIIKIGSDGLILKGKTKKD